MNNFEKISKAIYSNKLFAINFAPYEPEFFPIEKEVQLRDTIEKYSEFECEILLEKHKWFKTLKKFQIKKAKTDVSQIPGFDVILNEKPVGFVEDLTFLDKGGYRLGFCVKSTKEEGYEWKWYRMLFDDMDDLKNYINVYYGRIQERFDFYEEQPEPEPEEKVNKNNGDDYTF